MEFRILGALEVVAGDRPLELGGVKQRSVLAMLVLGEGRTVPVDDLIEGLWGMRAPATATKSLQVYVSRLRKSLGEEVIVTRAPGYALAATADQVDGGRFERLVGEARAQPSAEAAETLRTALALWRGPALADLADEPFAGVEIARFEELRQAAIEDRVDADLALGRHAELVAELEALVRSHPFRERLTGQLMLALYRSGRQANALEVYREARATLAGELGIEPGPELKELERRILSQDPSLAAPARPHSAAPRDRTSRRRRFAALVGAVLVAGVAAGVIAAVLRGTAGGGPLIADANSVAVIDPDGNAVMRTIALGERPTRIAIHGDDVWVLHPDRSTVTHLNRVDGTVLGTVAAGRAPSDLAADARGVWVSDARTGGVTLLEPQRLTVVKQVRTRPRPLSSPYPDAGHMSSGFGSLWVATGDRTITRIDERTGRVTARIDGVDAGQSDGGIAVGGGSVWVAGPTQESPLVRIDPTRNRVLARIPIRKFRSSGIAYGGGVIWVSDAGNDQVWRVDPARNIAVGTTPVGSVPLGVLFAHGSIWVANAGDGTVSRIDPVTGRVVQTVTVGGSPSGLAASKDRVWVTVG